MNQNSSTNAPRLAIGSIAIAVSLAVALVGCSSSSAPAPKAAAPATGYPSGTVVPAVAVPKYVAAENARKNVTASTCTDSGAKGWLIKGTATNSSTSPRSFSIVVDFVTRKGDTVLDTKIVRVPSVAPRATKHWSALGAPGQTKVLCVIRQALARA